MKRRLKFSVRLRNWLWSGFYFALGFIGYNYLGHVITSLAAMRLGYDVSFSYAGMKTLMHTTGWSVWKIAFVYVSPSLIALLLSVVFYLRYRRVAKPKLHRRLFFIWMSFNGLLYYFSQIISGIVSGYQFDSKFFTGFVSFYAWLGWGSSKTLMILLIQALVALPVVYLFVKPFHQLSYSNKLLVSRARVEKWFEFLVIPVFAGSVIISVATFPMDVRFMLVRIGSAFLVSTTMLLFLNTGSPGTYKIVKGGIKSRSNPLLLLFVLALILLSRVALSIQIVV